MRPLLAAVIALLVPLASVEAVWQGVHTATWLHRAGNQGLVFADQFRLRSEREHVAQAMLLVFDRSCAGFVANRSNQVVTAAHCIPENERRIPVQTRDGKRYVARLERIDRDTDLALLELPHPLPAQPLALGRNIPEPGADLLFVGRFDRGGKAQRATLTKLGRCPSLPKVEQALFTSIQARPGDSGAPVLDAELRVVALVHGGARCHIAAPVAPLARQLASDAGPPRILAHTFAP